MAEAQQEGRTREGRGPREGRPPREGGFREGGGRDDRRLSSAGARRMPRRLRRPRHDAPRVAGQQVPGREALHAERLHAPCGLARHGLGQGVQFDAPV